MQFFLKKYLVVQIKFISLQPIMPTLEGEKGILPRLGRVVAFLGKTLREIK